MGDSFHSSSPTTISSEDCPIMITDHTVPSDNNNNNNNNNGYIKSCSTKKKYSSHRWALGLFSITTVLLFADQNLMSPNLTTIADEFNMNDEERDRKLGGNISLAFFLLGAPASFVVGLLADTQDRSKVFGWTVFIGEMACFLTYFVRSYNQLYICRAVTGFSIGGALPVIYSILGDLYSAEGML
jgi:MFS family permease